MPIEEAPILVERSSEGWAVVLFNRPHKLNTLSIALRRQLDQVVRELEADPAIHVLILSATGTTFTAGLDLDEWTGELPAAGAYAFDAVASLQLFSGPVIAAINGAAVTGGVEIALACDFIVASEHAKFADTHVRVGLLPGWGGSARLVQRVGLARAKELALTARFFSAQEAAQWGFVNHVVPHDQLLPFAQSLARDMLKAEPQHLKAYKALLDAEAALPLDQAIALERGQSMANNLPVGAADIQTRLLAWRQKGKR
jgi:enoyl-CoA hydratase